jgi:hypothetical protein
MPHNFKSPSEILDSYIQKFEHGLGSGNSSNSKRRSKTKRSSKERSKNHTTKHNGHNNNNKPKRRDLDALLSQSQVMMMPARAVPCNLQASLANFLAQTENPVEQVEKLIGNLKFRMSAYKQEMASAKDKAADTCPLTKAATNDLNDFKCRSKNLMDSLNSFKDVFSSANSNFKQSTDESESYTEPQPPLLHKLSFKQKFLLSEEPIPQEVSENECDSAREEEKAVEEEDPLVKCISKFQDLNKKLAISKQLDTSNDLKLFDSRSLLVPSVHHAENIKPSPCTRQVVSCPSPPPKTPTKSMNSNPECFVYSTNRCVQNFINECIKITNEIPIITTKINQVK